MENEFIPYEQALALKELGFDEECLGYFWKHSSFIDFEFMYGSIAISNDRNIPAPLYQQAFRWFREKHNLHTIINITISDKWYFEIYNLSDKRNCEIKIEEIFLSTYEEAQFECLKRLIEIVKIK